MAKASARHILVNTKEECESLKDQIDGVQILQRLPSNTRNVHQDKKAEY